jgi:hypothetical protein
VLHEVYALLRARDRLPPLPELSENPTRAVTPPPDGANILAEAGLEPAPERNKKRTWKQFLRSHWETQAATRTTPATPKFQTVSA